MLHLPRMSLSPLTSKNSSVSDKEKLESKRNREQRSIPNKKSRGISSQDRGSRDNARLKVENLIKKTKRMIVDVEATYSVRQKQHRVSSHRPFTQDPYTSTILRHESHIRNQHPHMSKSPKRPSTSISGTSNAVENFNQSKYLHKSRSDTFLRKAHDMGSIFAPSSPARHKKNFKALERGLEIEELTQLIMSLDQDSFHAKDDSKQSYRSYSIESEMKIVEAMFPPKDVKINPSPKRIALCFSLLQKLLARTSKGYQRLSNRLIDEIANATYVKLQPEDDQLNLCANKWTIDNLMNKKQAYFQIADELTVKNADLTAKITELELDIAKFKFSNKKKAAALGSNLVRRQRDLVKRYFNEWRGTLRKNKRIVAKMTKKMMKIYLRGLHENCRKKKLRRYKNKIADLEDPLEKKKNQKELNFYKVNYEMLTEQLKSAMQENKMLKETLEKKKKGEGKLLRKQSNATASSFLQVILKSFDANVEARRRRLLPLLCKKHKILRTKILDCEKKPEEDEEEDDDESNSANSHDNQVTKIFNQLKLQLDFQRQAACQRFLGSGTAGEEANPNWFPDASVSDNVEKRKQPEILTKKQRNKEKKRQLKVMKTMQAIQAKKWNTKDITNGITHANNAAKANNREIPVSPSMQESLLSIMEKMEEPLFSDVDIFAILGVSFIESSSYLVGQLYSDWMDNLDADDIDQYLPSKQFSTGPYRKAVKGSELNEAVIKINEDGFNVSAMCNPSFHAALLFAVEKSSLTRDDLKLRFAYLPKIFEPQANSSRTLKAILSQVDQMVHNEVERKRHWTKCHNLFLLFDENTEAFQKKYQWIMEPSTDINIGLEDVENLIILWVNHCLGKASPVEDIDNLGPALRSSAHYLELVKYLSKTLKYDQLGSQENALVFGDEEMTDRIDKALKSLDFQHRASCFLDEVANKFKVPVELIKVEDIVDGNNEWSLDLLAYIFTSISPGLEPDPGLIDDEIKRLFELEKQYMDLKDAIRLGIPADSLQHVENMCQILSAMDKVEKDANSKIHLVRKGDVLYKFACTHISKIVYENLSRRARGTDSLNQIRNEKIQASIYSKLKRERIQDILFPKASSPKTNNKKKSKSKPQPTDEEEDDIEAQVEKDVLITEEFLSQHHVALRRIYKAYAAQGGGGVAIKQEIFLKFCKDCKIPDKKFTEHMLPIVFIRANWDDPNESKDPKNKRVAAALNPSEWVEALVRCANGKYLEEKSLYKKIKRLIEVHVLPHAQRSDVDAFRRNMKTEEMSQVLKKHEDNLLATFKKYAQAELSHGVQSTFGDVSKDTINVNEFNVFMKEKKLLDSSLSNKMVLGIFNNVQSEGDALNENDLESLEMDYSEFTEAIIAIAAWKMPSPFLAFDQRVDMFLSNVLFKGGVKGSRGGKKGKKKK